MPSDKTENPMKRHFLPLLAILMTVEGCTPAPIQFALPVADGMVIQRGREIPLRGTTEPGAAAKVRTNLAEYLEKGIVK